MKYEETVRVLGIEEINDFVKFAKEHAESSGDFTGDVDVQFGCVEHSEVGVIAAYDTIGVLVMSCPKCKRIIAQVEVAEQARSIPMRYKN